MHGGSPPFHVSRDRRRVVRPDVQLKCLAPAHRMALLLVGCPALVAFVIGYPAAGVVILFRNRHRLDQRKIKYRYGILCSGYRADRWWWESVIAARKVSIVLLSVLGAAGNSDADAFCNARFRG